MGKDVIIACDFSSKEEAMDFLSKFSDEKPFVKIGMELFYASGPEIVKELKERGHKVFLDLKLHDIPNTVKKSMSVLRGLGADMINVHASGTIKMMEAAMEGVKIPGKKDPVVLAVTQLTSTSEERMHDDLLINASMEETVVHYAECAKKAGLTGVVCSPLEAGKIHEKCGKDFITVTPGVRLSGDSVGDQVRVTTPAKAKELGSDYIVVGRSITQAKNPVLAWKRCLKEFTE